MIRVINKHTAMIDGIAPGQEGEVDENSPAIKAYLEGRPDADPPVEPLLVKATATARKHAAADAAESSTDTNSEHTPPAVGGPEGSFRAGTGEEIHAPASTRKHR